MKTGPLDQGNISEMSREAAARGGRRAEFDYKRIYEHWPVNGSFYERAVAERNSSVRGANVIGDRYIRERERQGVSRLERKASLS